MPTANKRSSVLERVKSGTTRSLVGAPIANNSLTA
jgi:hypothetical protein